MLREEKTSVELLKNHAKTFGGVIGAEAAYLTGKVEFD